MTKSKSADNDYRRLDDELQALLSRLEQGDLEIEEAVRVYERGLEIMQTLQHRLMDLENKVTQLREQADATDGAGG